MVRARLPHWRQSSIRFEPLQGILCTVVIHHARFPIDEDLFAPYEVIGELGKRPVPVYVARQSALAVGGALLVIAEHFPGACKVGDLRREARRISTLANPHLARVREVAVRGDDLVVFGDFLDGEKLTHFWRPGEWLPLEVALRVLLDVLTGIGALHALRDSNQQPMKLTHGEISPATILFGADGVARVLHAVARRATDASTEAASLPYLAPEVHTNDARDGRADVFSVGVLLWEVLAGKRFADDGEEAPGLRVRSGPLPEPAIPEKAPWAKALAPVVAKALAVAPEDRWATAAAMAAEIRKAAGLKLAAASAAAAFAKSKFGDRVKQRRARWEARPSRAPAAMPSPWPEAAAPVARTEEYSSSLLESYRPPPPAIAAAVSPIAVPAVSPVAPVVSPVAPVVSLFVPAVAEVAAGDIGRVDTSAELDFAPPSAASKDSMLSIPPPDLLVSASIPEPPPSAEAPVPFEAPVVFDEVDVAPIPSPLGDPSPMPPALSTSDAPAGGRSRRRHLLLGGVAALGIAALSVVAVRASHPSAPPPAIAQAAVAPVPPPGASPAPVISPAGAPPASAVAVTPAPQSVATPAPPTSAAAGHTASPKAKAGSKTKTPAVGGLHPKSGPVRPQTHPKPGSN
jgi:Protein kinase domain